MRFRAAASSWFRRMFASTAFLNDFSGFESPGTTPYCLQWLAEQAYGVLLGRG